MPLSAEFTPYSTAKELLGTLPTWVDSEDAQRIGSYQLYEEMYWNVPTIFKLDARGSENKPIYVPSARSVVETFHRHTARNAWFRVLPTVGTPQERELITQAMSALLKREEWKTKHGTQKRYGLIRGDSFWHIVGNDTAMEGRKISLYEVDPAAVFWIYDPLNLSRVIGVHIAEKYTDADLEKEVVRRQTYMKQDNGTITSQLSIVDVENWDDVEKATVLEDLKPVAALPPEITSLPVYGTKNQRVGGTVYGSSQLRGFERLFSAVNQSISDEELTLAMQGIGVYATTSGPPVDENGDETDWVVGPGVVVEHAEGTTFEHIQGISSIQPMTEHQNQLMKFIYEGQGIPDILRGNVDVSVAESGIALYLKTMPMLSQVDEKNDLFADTHDHMFFDLQHMWLPAFEGIRSENAIIEPYFDGPLPEDKAGKVKEVLAIGATTVGTTPIVSTQWVREQLARVSGYEFPEDIEAQVAADLKVAAENADLAGARAATEPLQADAEGL